MFCWDVESGRKYVRRSRPPGDHPPGDPEGGAESGENQSASLGYSTAGRNKLLCGVTRVSLRVPRKSPRKRLGVLVCQSDLTLFGSNRINRLFATLKAFLPAIFRLKTSFDIDVILT